MIKAYQKPEIEIVNFVAEDVITVSGIIEKSLKGATVTGGFTNWNEEWNAFDLN